VRGREAWSFKQWRSVSPTPIEEVRYCSTITHLLRQLWFLNYLEGDQIDEIKGHSQSEGPIWSDGK
jgi:hypothetical protein